MTWQKLTPSIKKNITRDWHTAFPSLGIYQPMHLLNRAGPLLAGILLERDSGNNNYMPMFHVHNLTRPFSTITLSLSTTLNREYVHVEWHESKYRKLVEQMKSTAFIPFEGDLELQRVLVGYRTYLEAPRIPYQLFDYEDMVLISAWCENTKAVHTSLEFTAQSIKRWPQDIVDRIEVVVGDLHSWLKQLEEKANDPATLRIICEQQIIALQVGGLPVRNLLS